MRIRILTLTVAVCGIAFAQRGPGGRGGPMFRSPLVAALDADKDGSLSAQELAGAPKALLALDQDWDGAISAEEARPEMQAREGARGGSPDMVITLFSFDENKDGKLSKSEVPERMQGIFARADADKDGFLTREELTKAAAAQEQRGGPGREGGGPPDMAFRAIDKDQDGKLSAVEIAGATAALKALDKNGDGILNPDEMRPAMGGGMRDPKAMVSRMFDENDANNDGKLSKAEMPERMQAMFERADLDKDGFVSKEELGKMFENTGGRRQ